MKELFILANDDKDEYARSFFTKITFHGSSDNNELSKLDIWIIFPYLYDISDFVKALVYERKDFSIDLSEFPLSQIKEFIYHLHGVIERPKYYGHWLQILDKLLIDNTKFFTDTDIYNLALNDDPYILDLYKLNDIENFTEKFDKRNYGDSNIILEDKYLDFYKLCACVGRVDVSTDIYVALMNCQFEIVKYIMEKGYSINYNPFLNSINKDNLEFAINKMNIDLSKLIDYCLVNKEKDLLFAVLDRYPEKVQSTLDYAIKKDMGLAVQISEKYLKKDKVEFLKQCIKDKKQRICLDLIHSDKSLLNEDIISYICKCDARHLFNKLAKSYLVPKELHPVMEKYASKHKYYTALREYRELTTFESLQQGYMAISNPYLDMSY